MLYILHTVYFTCCIFYILFILHVYFTWGTQNSRSFKIPLGIKQRGINSPDFFSCYCDSLIKILRDKKIGCKLYMIILAIILFADDMCLLAPTRSSLEILLAESANYCNKLGLQFNPKKSKILVFSKKKVDTSVLKPILLNGAVIEYATSVKYLGVTLISDRGINFSATKEIQTFYRAANSILTSVNKPNEQVLMQLLYTNCVPIISYACNVKIYSAQDMRDCNTAVNDAIRKIFTYQRWESVRSLRDGFQMKSVYEMFKIASDKFQLSLANHPNSILRHIHSNVD